MKKKEYSYENFHFREICKMFVSLEKESDRAVALIVAAWVDDALSEAIKRWLVDDKKAIEAIFQHDSALGSFSSRITLGYLIRRYSKAIHDNLHTIRSIRNDFAHSREPLRFSDQSVKARCDNLLLKFFKGQKGTPRNAYIATGVSILGTFVEFITAPTMSSDGNQDFAVEFIKHTAEHMLLQVKNFAVTEG